MSAEEGSAIRWVWLSALVVAVDQATKALVVARFELFERKPLLPVLELTRLHNKGAAFSFLNDASGWQHYLFLGLAAFVSVGIVVWLSRLRGPGGHWLAAGLALILGGAVGNAIDRLARGFVVDFIHVHWGERWYFPAFNVADSAITVGAAMLIIDALLESRRAPPGAP
ncbi:MAG: signal peptidase II [Proteobacteria bacterium]|nr:signal peptidase II [Pseudomonadota bacterium]